MVFGAMFIAAGVVCFGILLLGLVFNIGRIPSPTETTSGIVITYVPGAYTRPTRQSDDCTYAYKVAGETYTLSSTCGSLPGDRDGSKAEIIYSIDEPRKAYVNRQGFFYLAGLLGIPLVVIGLLLIRKGRLMDGEEMYVD